MKKVIHAKSKKPEGGTLCGTRASLSRQDNQRVTCERCIRILTGRTWIPR